jgi:hypothetical protein
MVYVTLVDGTELQYNTGACLNCANGFYTVGTRDPADKNALAVINVCLIARIEFTKPCKVVKPAQKRERRNARRF